MRALLLLLLVSVGFCARLKRRMHAKSQPKIGSADAIPDNSTCLPISGLNVKVATIENQIYSLEEWGCPESTPCQICMGNCAETTRSDADNGFFLYWQSDRPQGNALPAGWEMAWSEEHNAYYFYNDERSVWEIPPTRLRMQLGSQEIGSEADHRCADFRIQDGTFSELYTLGGLHKVLKGVCKKTSMRTVAYLQMSIIQALGVLSMRVIDQSHFAEMPCSWMPDVVWVPVNEEFPAMTMPQPVKLRPPVKYSYFEAPILKLATKGRTMYQDWYETAFMVSEGCQTEFDKFRQSCVDNHLDAVAEEVLEFTRSMKSVMAKNILNITDQDVEGCVPAMEKFKQVKEHASKELDQCIGAFDVDVRISPSCTNV